MTTRHRKIFPLLYEYVMQELKEEECLAVEQHLARCHKCRNAAEDLRQAVALHPRQASRASDERSAEFWTTFADRIGEKIAREGRSGLTGAVEAARHWIAGHRPHAAGAGLALAGILAAMLLWHSPGEKSARTGPPGDQEVVYEPPAELVGHYFRRSKTLLVGLANMKAAEGMPLDLAPEKETSRMLAQEARHLRMQPLDPHAARLIGDVEKIMIGLANVKDEQASASVELLRAGVRQENLLFKLRMAEAAYDSVRFLAIKEHPEGR